MNNTTTIAAILLMGTALVGCDAAEQEPAPPAAEQERTGEQGPATDTAASAEEAATIRVDSLADTGAYITDADGRALYVLEGETAESTCYDQCAEEWPPFLAPSGEPTPGAASIQADQLGTTERRDGSLQVTLDGMPLYYYHDDVQPGETSGHHLTDQWGEWYLVQPNGQLLEGGEESS